MKQNIHPEYMLTKVKCNGCGISFETHSTVPEITVEICSNCHPFYTGKQKLVDTAGRVDRFNALRDRAAKLQADAKPKATRTKATAEDPVVEMIEAELEDKTVHLPSSDSDSDQPTKDSDQ